MVLVIRNKFFFQKFATLDRQVDAPGDARHVLQSSRTFAGGDRDVQTTQLRRSPAQQAPRFARVHWSADLSCQTRIEVSQVFKLLILKKITYIEAQLNLSATYALIIS
jgi:hypothetical protein